MYIPVSQYKKPYIILGSDHYHCEYWHFLQLAIHTGGMSANVLPSNGLYIFSSSAYNQVAQ